MLLPALKMMSLLRINVPLCLVLQGFHAWCSLQVGGTVYVLGTPAPAMTPAAHACAPSDNVLQEMAAWSWALGPETSVRTPWQLFCPPRCTGASASEEWRGRRTAWVFTGVFISLCCMVRLILALKIICGVGKSIMQGNACWNKLAPHLH